MIRTLALRVLREILSKQPWRFKNYAELTIMKALEAHKDPHKEVTLFVFTELCLKPVLVGLIQLRREI